MLKALFGSEAKVKVLALFMLHPASEFYLREVARRTGLPVRAAERTLATLTEIGLLHRQERGNNVYFSVNRDSPIFPELKVIFLKTVGLGDLLRAALADQEGIEVAFVYGSYAKNQEAPTSDVDLFIVGSASPRTVAQALGELERETGREINATVFTPEELARRVRHGDHFSRAVLAGPKIFLIGDEHVLHRIVG